MECSGTSFLFEAWDDLLGVVASQSSSFIHSDRKCFSLLNPREKKKADDHAEDRLNGIRLSLSDDSYGHSFTDA